MLPEASCYSYFGINLFNKYLLSCSCAYALAGIRYADDSQALNRQENSYFQSRLEVQYSGISGIMAPKDGETIVDH